MQRKLAPSEWIVRDDQSLRIVSDELWQRVRARLAARKARQPKGGKPARYVRHDPRRLVNHADLRLYGRLAGFQLADPGEHRGRLSETYQRIDVERMVVARIEALEHAVHHPEHGLRARVTAQETIGSVREIEEGDHIVAEIDGGRLLMLGAAPDVTYGAQELSRGLLSIRARR